MVRVAVVVKETLKKEELRTMAMENLLPLSSTLSIHSGRTGKIFKKGGKHVNPSLLSFGVDNPELMRLSNIALLRCFNNMVRSLSHLKSPNDLWSQFAQLNGCGLRWQTPACQAMLCANLFSSKPSPSSPSTP